MDDVTTTDQPVSPFEASPPETDQPAAPSGTGRAVPLRVSDNALSQVMGILAAEDDPESLAQVASTLAARNVDGVIIAAALREDDDSDLDPDPDPAPDVHGS